VEGGAGGVVRVTSFITTAAHLLQRPAAGVT
jgi:hypothetical protein